MTYQSVGADISGALRKFRMTETEAKKAISRALNKTAVTVRKETSGQIQDAGYGLKVSDIKAAVSISNARPNFLQTRIRAKGRPIPLAKFKARQTAKGVTVTVKTGRKPIVHAFMATMKSGHEGVFLRVGKQHKRVLRNGKATWSGLPIRELHGPAIPAMFIDKQVAAAQQQTVRTRFPVVLDQELNYLRSKARAV